MIRAANEFRDKTSRPDEPWQTGFTCLKVIGWGWFYLSTLLDDDSRYIIAWKLCTTMKAKDVTDRLELALEASGCDQAIGGSAMIRCGFSFGRSCIFGARLSGVIALALCPTSCRRPFLVSMNFT